MKNLLFILFALVMFNTASAQQDQEVVRLSEPVQVTDEYEVFGSELEEHAENRSITLKASITELDTESESEIFIKTTVHQVCKKKGCFFIAVDGDQQARVTCKYYSFFIIQDSVGKEVIIRGVVAEKILSEDQAKHYAEDEGRDSSDIQGEQKEYSIVATSLLVPKSK